MSVSGSGCRLRGSSRADGQAAPFLGRRPHMSEWWMQRTVVTGLAVVALAASSAGRARAADRNGRESSEGREREEKVHKSRAEKTLYIWAGDAERARPDFLAVIDFNENSANYGKVLRTVPLPPPGNVGNEPHHCHLSVDKNVLAAVPVLHQRSELQHHRRLPAIVRRRLPGDADGFGDGGRTGPRRRVRPPPPADRRVPHQPTHRRIQPPRDLRTLRPGPARHQ